MNYINTAHWARIVFLLILLLAMVFGGLIWLDFLGVFEFKEFLSPLTSFFGIEPQVRFAVPFSPTLLNSSRLAKEQEAIAIQWEELEQSRSDFEFQEAELRQKESELAEREKSVEERQNSLNEAVHQYDNKVANLEQTARYLMQMPPQDAVEIMEEYELKNLVDLLRTSERLSQQDGEASLVAFWLSLMTDRNRAAQLQRLMVEKPGLSLND